MAIVVSVSSEDREATVDAANGRTLAIKFYVERDDGTLLHETDAIDALAAFSPPVYIGRPHPRWAACLCTQIVAKPEPGDPDSRWLVTATYREPRPVPGQTPGTPSRPSPEEPADQDPEFGGQFRLEDYYEPEDLDGEPFKNTADDPLENAPPLKNSIGVLTFTKRYDYADWSYDLGRLLVNSVNLYEWRSIPEDCLRVTGLSFKAASERGRDIWVVTYTLEDNRKGWIPTKVLNIGRNVILPDGSKGPAVTGKGQTKNGLVFLDVNGEEAAEPMELEFRHYDRLDFESEFGP